MIKKSFTIALLGIDGSGKSTIAKELKKWLITKGYKVRIVPFHHWVFAHKLRKKTWKVIDKDRPSIDKPYEPKKKSFAAIIKPVVALIDNILFYIHNLPDKNKYNVVIFDRFICATQIKLSALNYQTYWLKPIWWNIIPDYTLIFQISEEISIKRQKNRDDPFVYTKKQLAKERELYQKFAIDHNLNMINNETTNLDITLKKIKEDLKQKNLI